MSEFEFSTEYPTSEVPTLPEYFKKFTLAGLLPGEVAFPYGFVIGADTQTNQLFIKTGNELDSDALRPSFFGNRAGVMRIFEATGDRMLDGYIVDARYIKLGEVGSVAVHLPENASDFDRRNAALEIEHQGIRPLLAAVFADPEGQPHFLGTTIVQSHMEQLMTAVDEARTPRPKEEAEEEA